MVDVSSFREVDDLCREKTHGRSFSSPQQAAGRIYRARGTEARPDPAMGVKRPNDCSRGGSEQRSEGVPERTSRSLLDLLAIPRRPWRVNHGGERKGGGWLTRPGKAPSHPHDGTMARRETRADGRPATGLAGGDQCPGERARSRHDAGQGRTRQQGRWRRRHGLVQHREHGVQTSDGTGCSVKGQRGCGVDGTGCDIEGPGYGRLTATGVQHQRATGVAASTARGATSRARGAGI